MNEDSAPTISLELSKNSLINNTCKIMHLIQCDAMDFNHHTFQMLYPSNHDGTTALDKFNLFHTCTSHKHRI